MCELMAMCFAHPVAAKFSIGAFALRDAENPDGWGLAWYDGRSLSIVKEPLSWRRSGYAEFLAGYDSLVSHMYIAHVRHATIGGPPKHADTHPFARELDSRFYCFAHNGTIRKASERLLLERYQPIGDTDSERVFCAVLDAMVERHHPLATTDDWNWLAEQFHDINRMGKLNCILADGERLFAWHDVGGFKGLHFHGVRIGDGRVTHLEDPEMEVAVAAATDDVNRGVVIATCPLSDSGWHAMLPGELLVAEAGRIRFSNRRSKDRTSSSNGAVHGHTATGARQASARKQANAGADRCSSGTG